MIEKHETLKESKKTRLVCNSSLVRDLPAKEFCEMLENASAQELEMILNSLEGDSYKKGQKQERSIGSIIFWWELRRPLFNLIIGLCGLLTLLALSIVNHAPGYYLLLGTITYFVALNVSYTLAWLLDLFVHLASGGKGAKFGKELFQHGTLLSVMVTLALTVILPITMLFIAPWG